MSQLACLQSHSERRPTFLQACGRKTCEEAKINEAEENYNTPQTPSTSQNFTKLPDKTADQNAYVSPLHIVHEILRTPSHSNIGRRRAKAASLIDSPARSGHCDGLARIFGNAHDSINTAPVRVPESKRLLSSSSRSTAKKKRRQATPAICITESAASSTAEISPQCARPPAYGLPMVDSSQQAQTNEKSIDCFYEVPTKPSFSSLFNNSSGTSTVRRATTSTVAAQKNQTKAETVMSGNAPRYVSGLPDMRRSPVYIWLDGITEDPPPQDTYPEAIAEATEGKIEPGLVNHTSCIEEKSDTIQSDLFLQPQTALRRTSASPPCQSVRKTPSSRFARAPPSFQQPPTRKDGRLMKITTDSVAKPSETSKATSDCLVSVTPENPATPRFHIQEDDLLDLGPYVETNRKGKNTPDRVRDKIDGCGSYDDEDIVPCTPFEKAPAFRAWKV